MRWSLQHSFMKCTDSRRLAKVAGLVALFSCSYALASTAILRGPAPAGQKWSVQTYAGPVEVTVSPLRPSPSVTILVLLDTLTSKDKEQIRRELLDFYSEFHGRPIQLAFLGKGEFTGPVSASTRVRFKQLLEKSMTDEDSGLVPSASSLDDLIAVIPKLGPNRSAVLLLGELPKLDAASTAFASALLVRTFTTQQLRASLFSPAAVEQDWFPLFRSLGGETVTNLHDLSLGSPGSAESLFQLDWTIPPPAAGFVVSRSTVANELSVSVIDVPDFSAPAGAPTPSIEQYSGIQKKIAEAETLLAEEPLTQARADRVRENIQTALQLNSRDPDALTVATALYEKAQDYHAAASMS